MNIQHSYTDRGGRFYSGDPAAPTALLTYRMAGPHKMIIDHTEVNEQKGTGIGTQLVATAVDFARQHDIRILPLCSFARHLFETTGDYKDVLDTHLPQ